MRNTPLTRCWIYLFGLRHLCWADCKGIWDNMWWNPQPKHEMDRSTWEWFRFCASKLKLTYCTARMTIGLPNFANRFSHIFLRWFTFLSCVSAEVAMRWSVSTRATSFWRSGIMAVPVKNPMIPVMSLMKWCFSGMVYRRCKHIMVIICAR